MKTLGQVLKESRLGSQKTLRDVEESTGISNAYLSQLENDKIKKPSANILYKLSDIYEVELDVFLLAAGIIQKKKTDTLSELQRKLAFYADKLTSEDELKILEYIDYIRFKNKNV